MDYFEENRKLWNNKTPIHLNSDFYQNQSFLEGRNTLNKPELDLLGDVTNKKILHLQCHFGQDSISLSRMGAEVVGVDLSDESIKLAVKQAKQLNQNVQFINCNVYDIDQHLTDKYDKIFTSYGTIGWLPDLDKYFKLISKHLNKGGQFIIVDFHPFLWMWDYEYTKIEHAYFNKKPIIEESETTYTDGSKHAKTSEIGWNHDFGEIFGAILNNQLSISDFQEYDYSPFNCFSNMIECEQGFRIKKWEDKIPMLYSIVATTV